MSQQQLRRQRAINRKFSKFDSLYYEFYLKVVDLLKEKSTQELEQLIQDSKTFTTSNCGWGTYAVAPLVRDEAKRMLQSRITLPIKKSIEHKGEKRE